nr:MAG TPA: hypothetical protein [Microviridae sp.]
MQDLSNLNFFTKNLDFFNKIINKIMYTFTELTAGNLSDKIKTKNERR